MFVTVYEMRSFGVAVPKRLLATQTRHVGHLAIKERRDDGHFRTITTARLWSADGSALIAELYDPAFVWVNEGRMMIKGFEKRRIKDEDVDYAQSWLCILGDRFIDDGESSERGPHSFNKRR